MIMRNIWDMLSNIKGACIVIIDADSRILMNLMYSFKSFIVFSLTSSPPVLRYLVASVYFVPKTKM